MSKGMMYTAFAILSASMLLIIVGLSLEDRQETGFEDVSRIGDASFFVDSVVDDFDRYLDMSVRRALTNAVNVTVVTGEGFNESQENVAEILINGTLSGDELNDMENASIKGWGSRVSKAGESAGYIIEVDLDDLEFEGSDGFEIDVFYNVSTVLEDPTSRAVFNRSGKGSTSVSVEGLDDTLLFLKSKGRYNSQYEACRFDDPAERLERGSVYSDGVGYGEAVFDAEVSDASGKILVVEDVGDYESSVVNQFEGFVSVEIVDESSYNNEFVMGVDSVSSVDEEIILTLFEGDVWRTSFETVFDTECYLPSGNAPGFFQRLENSDEDRGNSEGIATLINIERLPSELVYEDSAVGHVYFGSGDPDSDYSIEEIKGVSDSYNWFRIDSNYIDYWDLDDLVKE